MSQKSLGIDLASSIDGCTCTRNTHAHADVQSHAHAHEHTRCSLELNPCAFLTHTSRKAQLFLHGRREIATLEREILALYRSTSTKAWPLVFKSRAAGGRCQRNAPIAKKQRRPVPNCPTAAVIVIEHSLSLVSRSLIFSFSPECSKTKLCCRRSAKVELPTFWPRTVATAWRAGVDEKLRIANAFPAAGTLLIRAFLHFGFHSSKESLSDTMRCRGWANMCARCISWCCRQSVPEDLKPGRFDRKPEVCILAWYTQVRSAIVSHKSQKGQLQRASPFDDTAYREAALTRRCSPARAELCFCQPNSACRIALRAQHWSGGDAAILRSLHRIKQSRFLSSHAAPSVEPCPNRRLRRAESLLQHRRGPVALPKGRLSAHSGNSHTAPARRPRQLARQVRMPHPCRLPPELAGWQIPSDSSPAWRIYECRNVRPAEVLSRTIKTIVMVLNFPAIK